MVFANSPLRKRWCVKSFGFLLKMAILGLGLNESKPLNVFYAFFYCSDPCRRYFHLNVLQNWLKFNQCRSKGVDVVCYHENRIWDSCFAAKWKRFLSTEAIWVIFVAFWSLPSQLSWRIFWDRILNFLFLFSIESACIHIIH